MLNTDHNKPIPRTSSKTISAKKENGEWKFEFGKGIAQTDIERLRKDIMSAWMKHE